MSEGYLPDGWSYQRVAEAAGGAAFEVLPSETLAFVDDRIGGDYLALRVGSILSFSGLCLVLNLDDGLWYMGQADNEGTIVCWAPYGADLGEAIRGL